MLSAPLRFLKRLASSRRGNVLMLMGFSVVPLTLATGISIDYARAARLQTRLNAAADAAALAAVTQPMMKESWTTAEAAARRMFNGQIGNLPGLIYNSNDPAALEITCLPTPASCAPGASNTRTLQVKYSAQSVNAFSGLIGMSTIAIGGVAKASASAAPDIDFYMLLDTSPSMLLPTTTAGLATLVSKTNCAFACHQTDLSPGGGEVLCTGSGANQVCKDYYTVARDNNIILRTDLLHDAVENLTTVATNTAATNGASYRMGLAGFDYMYRQLWPTTPVGGYNVDSNLTTVRSHVSDAQSLVYCKNNYRVCGTNDNDTATNFTAAFTGALASMPLVAGNGTKQPGDTPQAILFLITDGMRDEQNGGRKLGPIPTAQCATIKARGIRIAVLYTEYLPESASSGWSKTNVYDPYLVPNDKISPALISCASDGLYYKVTTDSDISAALQALFQQAVATAHLTQ